MCLRLGMCVLVYWLSLKALFFLSLFPRSPIRPRLFLSATPSNVKSLVSSATVNLHWVQVRLALRPIHPPAMHCWTPQASYWIQTKAAIRVISSNATISCRQNVILQNFIKLRRREKHKKHFPSDCCHRLHCCLSSSFRISNGVGVSPTVWLAFCCLHLNCFTVLKFYTLCTFMCARK